jgi:hypothetical protein
MRRCRRDGLVRSDVRCLENRLRVSKSRFLTIHQKRRERWRARTGDCGASTGTVSQPQPFGEGSEHGRGYTGECLLNQSRADSLVDLGHRQTKGPGESSCKSHARYWASSPRMPISRPNVVQGEPESELRGSGNTGGRQQGSGIASKRSHVELFLDGSTTFCMADSLRDN